MFNVARPAPFVLVSTNHGTMIVNRNDYKMVTAEKAIGVGIHLLNHSCFDPQEVDFAVALIHSRGLNFGAGAIAVDCGANIGVHTVEWARLMHGWGQVYSFEAQEKIFYALAGNVIINNCLNVTARHAAVGATCGKIRIPEPNYYTPSSFGSFALRASDQTEFIGQEIDYANPTKEVDLISIDSLQLPRLDFLKIDVEGMEMEVFEGAARAIEKHRPELLVEVVKSGREPIELWLRQRGYITYSLGLNLLALHGSDPALQRLKIENGSVVFS